MKSNLSTLPKWLTEDFLIVGSDNDDEDSTEEEDSDDESGDDEDEDEDSEEDESDEDEDSDGEDEDEDDKAQQDAAAGLKSALRKERKGHKVERRARMAAENENKQLKAQLEALNGKENEAVASVQSELDSERTKNTSLASKIKDQAIRSAVLAEATRQNFIDPEDAMSIAKAIEADQDPEDPTDIDIDDDAVKLEVAKLAKRKKHLVGGAPAKKTSTTKSGSKSTRRKKTKATDKGFDPTDYPSLV